MKGGYAASHLYFAFRVLPLARCAVCRRLRQQALGYATVLPPPEPRFLASTKWPAGGGRRSRGLRPLRAAPSTALSSPRLHFSPPQLPTALARFARSRLGGYRNFPFWLRGDRRLRATRSARTALHSVEVPRGPEQPVAPGFAPGSSGRARRAGGALPKTRPARTARPRFALGAHGGLVVRRAVAACGRQVRARCGLRAAKGPRIYEKIPAPKKLPLVVFWAGIFVVCAVRFAAGA